MIIPLDVAVRQKARLGRPVYGSAGQVLLQQGIVIRESYAKKLRALGISSVHIESEHDEQVEEPVSVNLRIQAAQALKAFGRGEGAKVNIEDLIENIMQDILAFDGIIENMSNIGTYDGYTFVHSIDVCVLAISIGIQLGFSRERLLELGIGALLHDVGKLKVPHNIINKPDKLSDWEFDLVKMHSAHGVVIVKNHKQVNERSTRIILEHHERWDGSGYPHAKMKDDIHRYSVICGIADVYNAMVTDRPYRRGFPSHEVYELLLGAGDSHFEFKVVKAFSRCVVPYPKGSLVMVSDGRAAKVVSSDPDHPYLPIVCFLGKDEEVSLLQNKLVVKELLPPEEVEQYIMNS